MLRFRNYLDKRICTTDCRHRTGLAFQLLGGPVGSFWTLSLVCTSAFACKIMPRSYWPAATSPMSYQPGSRRRCSLSCALSRSRPRATGCCRSRAVEEASCASAWPTRCRRLHAIDARGQQHASAAAMPRVHGLQAILHAFANRPLQTVAYLENNMQHFTFPDSGLLTVNCRVVLEIKRDGALVSPQSSSRTLELSLVRRCGASADSAPRRRRCQQHRGGHGRRLARPDQRQDCLSTARPDG